MSKPLVPTREVEQDGVKRRQYLCPEDGWVFGVPWDGTGYTEYLCPDCDRTLDSDPYGTFEAEKLGGLDDAGGGIVGIEEKATVTHDDWERLLSRLQKRPPQD